MYLSGLRFKILRDFVIYSFLRTAIKNISFLQMSVTFFLLIVNQITFLNICMYLSRNSNEKFSNNFIVRSKVKGP